MRQAVITIGIDPMIHLGPITLAWHGITIVAGIAIGGLFAARDARRRGLDPDPLQTMGLILISLALVGSRAFYLAEHGGLGDPAAWIGNRGFTFYGGFILVAFGLAVYVWRTRISLGYLDAIAVGLPLGYAIGRIGDIINGEHYGPATTFFLGVRNTHPDADVPSPDVAYHNGGLYESLIGLATFAIVLALRHRLRQPLAMVWLVIALMSAGRFAEFFVRSDSETVGLGLETAQWTSIVLIVVAAVGLVVTARKRRRPWSSRN
ncbi:MAG: prolipoprotein diacylglyceryl transferase [Gaiellaceae bacterium]